MEIFIFLRIPQRERTQKFKNENKFRSEKLREEYHKSL